MTKAGGVGDAPSLNPSEIERVLGEHGAKVIELISYKAQKKNLALYVAGGFVRDLLLRRQTLDLDFVLEGDAIEFARSLAKSFGGNVLVHKEFGTAKWCLDEGVTHSLTLVRDALPDSIDFVTARSESYTHPTALPVVSPADIESDLLRRDFSINALAIQLSPRARYGRLVDVCNGVKDLEQRLIRALHDHSFVDDPTRILRALRYALRLDFQLDLNTAEWMKTALPYLGRITGQRLRNEIDLILNEPRASDIMLQLQDLDALVNIHPAFRVSPRLPELIARVCKTGPPWSTVAVDGRTLLWIALMSGIGSLEVKDLCERLALTNKLTQAITASARLSEQIHLLEDPDIRPSQVAQVLDEYLDVALQSVWLLSLEKLAAREIIAAYASYWRDRRPTISGHDLKAMGVAPGPRYSQILDQLRFAWIDGDVRSVEDETALLQKLVENDD